MSKIRHATEDWVKKRYDIINTAKGSLIPLPDSAEAPIPSMKIFGKTKQATTTGKNKLPYVPQSKTTLYNGITFVENGDGTITVNGTATANATYSFIPTSKAFTLTTGTTYTLKGCPSGGSMDTYRLSIQTTDYLANYDDIGNGVTFTAIDKACYVFVMVKSGVTVNNLTFHPIIVEGSTYDGNWEPYTGGMPSPSFSYPQEPENNGDKGSIGLFVKGGNLFNNDTSLLEPVTYISSSSGTEQTRIGYDWFTLPVGVYTLSAKILDTTVTDLYIYGVKYNADGTKTMLNTIIGDIEQPPITFTVAEGDKILIYNGHNNLDYTAAAKFFNAVQIQLNPGAVAKPYEPYKSQSLTIPTPNGLPGVPVSSGGNYTDENGQQYVSDYKDYERKAYVQRVGKWIYTGGDVQISTCVVYQGYDVIYWNVKIPGVKAPNNFSSPALSNVFLTGKSVYSNSGYIMAAASIANYLYMSLKASDFGFAYGDGRDAEYKPAITNWMQTTFSEDNPLIALYELETPIETPLSEEEIAAYKALHTNYPNTTIYNDEGAYTEVKYVADTKNYVDNKIATEVAKLTAAIITE